MWLSTNLTDLSTLSFFFPVFYRFDVARFSVCSILMESALPMMWETCLSDEREKMVIGKWIVGEKENLSSVIVEKSGE